MLDAVASLLTYNTGIYFASGESPTRRGKRPSVGGAVPDAAAREGRLDEPRNSERLALDALLRRRRTARPARRPALRDRPGPRRAPADADPDHRGADRGADRPGVDGPARRRRGSLRPYPQRGRGLHESAARGTRQGRGAAASDSRRGADDRPADRARRDASPHRDGAAAARRAYRRRAARGGVLGRRLFASSGRTVRSEGRPGVGAEQRAAGRRLRTAGPLLAGRRRSAPRVRPDSRVRPPARTVSASARRAPAGDPVPGPRRSPRYAAWMWFGSSCVLSNSIRNSGPCTR